MPDSKLAEKLGFRVFNGNVYEGELIVDTAQVATVALWNLCLELSERLAGKWIPITPESMPPEGTTAWLRERTGEVELLYLLDFEDMLDCQNGRYTHFQLPIAPEPIAEAERLAEKEKKA